MTSLITDYNLREKINGADVLAKFNKRQPGKGKILGKWEPRS